MRERDLFIEALQHPDPVERRHFLDAACAGDETLRDRVLCLLCEHEKQESFLLDAPPPFVASLAKSASVAAPVDTAPGTVIGPYRLREQIGEGGMGTVWLAEQTEPVQRTVAIKIIKPGLESKQVAARFNAERQALAIMDHPNIARVLDADITETGLPYFAMELVRGVPITRYCDEHQLPLRQRLELFVPVCQAVQHAHQKGIIHRDLKPSNVLVAQYDGKPAPKVIDFGVAKATGPRLTEETVSTQVGQVVGTLEYMSPEQAKLNQLDIDTRSDIYSLGVLLYELLTGSTPLSGKQLKDGTILEVLRMIREDEPPRPSTRLSTAEDLPAIAANRGLEPKRLNGLVRGELDWVVMKCLEKDRDRRYETANALAMDVQRYLADEPVLACPPSRVYRLGKFLRRNRGPVSAAASIVLLLVGGVIGTTWGMIAARQAQEAESERADAEASERRRANTAEAEAKEKEARALAMAEVAMGVVEFVRTDLLAQAGAAGQAARRFPPKPNLTVREALDRAAVTVEARFRDQPVVAAAIRNTLGVAYQAVGDHEKAISQLRRAADMRAGYQGADHLETLKALDELAGAYRTAGKATEAVKILEEVRDAKLKSRGADDGSTLSTLNNLACAYREAGRPDEALALFEQVRDARLKTLGADDPETLKTLNNLATVYLDTGKASEAIPVLEQVHTARKKALAADHPDNLPTLTNLGVAYWKMKRLDRSVPLIEEVVSLSEKIYGGTHPETQRARANLGVNYRDAGRLDEAIALLKQAHAGGLLPTQKRWVESELLIAYVRAGKSADAIAQAKANVAAARKTHPAANAALATLLANNGATLLDLHAWADAEPILRECVAIRAKTEPDAWSTFNARSLLGDTLLGQQKYAEAEPLLLQGYRGIKEREAKIPASARSRLIHAIERLVRLYEQWDRPADAAKWRRELDAAKAANEKATQK